MDKIEKKIEFQAPWTKPQDVPSEPGQDIYDWVYEIDGEIVKESTNQFEMAQSYVKQTDYKEAIRKYGIENFNANVVGGASGEFLDISNYNDSYDDLNSRLERLANDLAEALAQEQRAEAKKVKNTDREHTKKDDETITEEE